MGGKKVPLNYVYRTYTHSIVTYNEITVVEGKVTLSEDKTVTLFGEFGKQAAKEKIQVETKKDIVVKSVEFETNKYKMDVSDFIKYAEKQ